MFCKVNGADTQGIQARMIQIEADISDGLPVFIMVGYLASAVKEARERVRIALKNTGYRFPVKRITVNLSPADYRKEGTTFDLPIAVALLAAAGYLSAGKLKEYLFIGELGLDGGILPVSGCMSMVDAAVRAGIKKCIVPKENEKEAAFIGEAVVYGVRHLSEITEFLNGKENLCPCQMNLADLTEDNRKQNIDFSDVAGQDNSKRALEIAVSGRHNILLMGPPGTGKTMLASRVPTIMPALSLEESIEITKIYSICGRMERGQFLVTKRPFRSPHHTITDTALIGGGRKLRPGEVTLASGGVLFLDEFLEFKKSTLELLRQPLEDRQVTVNRIYESYRYPADFMMIAAANPCKCGYYPDRNRCHCTEGEVRKYLSRVSKPVLDRIDLCTQTEIYEQRNSTDLNQRKQYRVKKQRTETSAEIRYRVEQVRKLQRERYRNEAIYFNAQLSPSQMKKFCSLTAGAKELLDEVVAYEDISMRGKSRIIKTSRTIADLAGTEKIEEDHIGEAVYYRAFGERFWEGSI